MNVRMLHEHTFHAAVYYEGAVVMNTYNIKLFMTTNTMDQDNHNIAYERMKYFLNELDSNVFIHAEEVEACKKLIDAGLKVTTFPSNAVDQIIGVMLFYKINAIMEDRMSLLETEITSTMSDNITYFHSENENIAMDTIPDWWTTPDLVHCDTGLTENEKVVTMHKSGEWRDLDLAWPNYEDEGDDEDPSPDNVVIVDFKRDEDK